MRARCLSDRSLTCFSSPLVHALLAAIAVGGFPGAYAGEPRTAATADPEDEADMFCGPRCVQAVLGFYGRQEELRPLIDEVQDRDWRRGSTLAALQSALERRGIYTAALRIVDGAQIHWSTPVIMHLRGRRADDIGHFVVLLPHGSADRAAVWCGLSGVQPVAPDELKSASSGAILLTAAAPIESPLTAVRWSRRWLGSPALAVLCILVAGAATRRSMRRGITAAFNVLNPWRVT